VAGIGPRCNHSKTESLTLSPFRRARRGACPLWGGVAQPDRQLLHHMQRGPHIDEIELHALDSDLLSFVARVAVDPAVDLCGIG
jgi:hypothetical protein